LADKIKDKRAKMYQLQLKEPNCRMFLVLPDIKKENTGKITHILRQIICILTNFTRFK